MPDVHEYRKVTDPRCPLYKHLGRVVKQGKPFVDEFFGIYEDSAGTWLQFLNEDCRFYLNGMVSMPVDVSARHDYVNRLISGRLQLPKKLADKPLTN